MNTKMYKNVEKLLHSSGKFRIKLGLERICAILKILGDPQEKIKVIHVAGTNGKGSVCTITAEILKSAGYKTAIYTSPHLFKYNERFKINGEDICDEDLSAYVFDVDNLAKKHGLDLSEFEILTAAAYKYFYDNKVDFAVMETGLGGRFDAVNAVQTPFLTAITSISIDHKDRLGDTIEKIALEKAGIIKSGVPIIVNTDNRGLNVIKKVANEKNALLFLAQPKVDVLFENGKNYAVFDSKKYEFNLWGLHQKQNLSLVLKMVEVLHSGGVKIPEKSIEKALRTAFIPARFQYDKKKNLIIDGAHNPDAAEILRKNLDFYFPTQERFWIYGTLTTKEYEKTINILFRSGDTIFFPKLTSGNFEKPENIITAIKSRDLLKIKKNSKTANTLIKFSKEQVTIVTGSFYMVNEIIKSITR